MKNLTLNKSVLIICFLFFFCCFKNFAQSKNTDTEFRKMAKFLVNEVMSLDTNYYDQLYNKLPWLVMVSFNIVDSNKISNVLVEGNDTLATSSLKKINWRKADVQWSIFTDSLRKPAKSSIRYFLPLLITKAKTDNEYKIPVFTERDVESFFFQKQFLNNPIFSLENTVVLQPIGIQIGESVR